MMLESLQCVSSASHYVIAANATVSAARPPYLDPGTGSLVIQILIGSMVGGLVGARLFWKRIVGSFSRLFNRISRFERTDH